MVLFVGTTLPPTSMACLAALTTRVHLPISSFSITRRGFSAFRQIARPRLQSGELHFSLFALMDIRFCYMISTPSFYFDSIFFTISAVCVDSLFTFHFNCFVFHELSSWGLGILHGSLYLRFFSTSHCSSFILYGTIGF